MWRKKHFENAFSQKKTKKKKEENASAIRPLWGKFKTRLKKIWLRFVGIEAFESFTQIGPCVDENEKKNC